MLKLLLKKQYLEEEMEGPSKKNSIFFAASPGWLFRMDLVHDRKGYIVRLHVAPYVMPAVEKEMR